LSNEVSAQDAVELWGCLRLWRRKRHEGQATFCLRGDR
jgi:hypothetical protein